MSELVDAGRRTRLVRVCAAISRDPGAAEDLAQETLLEAWRQRHKLRDPAGADAWLAAVARNVWLRSARKQARHAVVVARAVDRAVSDDFDLESELERNERVELLDRALGLLPPETREALVQRYVHESRHAEIGERLGISEDAVSMRLSRGKVALRRLLASELAGEAEALGLVDASDGGWRETRTWCSDCGRRRLVVRRDREAVASRCSDCNPKGVGAHCRLANPTLARLVGGLSRPTAILARTAEWASAYFLAGSESGRVACTRCGRATPVLRYVRNRDGTPSDGLYADCAACGEQVSSSARGLAQGVGEVRAFRREHARTRVAPHRQLRFAGVPAVAVRYEAALGRAAIDVVLARETLRLLHVATG